MELKSTQDIFKLCRGDVVAKRNLFDLIQYSKVETSSFWAGTDSIIWNTPQQGINWIGQSPSAIIIKTRLGSYPIDGWTDEFQSSYHYSFKAKNGKISYSEKANQVLINQPVYLYPIFLFIEKRGTWNFEGSFSVSEIEDTYVTLTRGIHIETKILARENEKQYTEGGRRYVTHLMVERNRNIVNFLKEANAATCDICCMDFFARYGVNYIEAHHKVPISTYSSSRQVVTSDFALLCPNCHKAVHYYMAKEDLEYFAIKARLSVQ